MIIYKTINKVNGKFYIGKDKNDDPNYLGSGIALKNAIKKYGKSNFEKEVIEKCNSLDELNKKEKYWIEKLNAKQCGYNIANGGEGGDIFSQLSKERQNEIIEIHRKNIINNNPMDDPSIKKKHHRIVSSDEYKNKMSKSIKENRKQNPEIVDNHSKYMKELLKNDDMKRKWSNAKKGKKNGRWLGYLIVEDTDGNKTVYDTAVDAAEDMGTKAHKLRECARGNDEYKRGPYKGYKFEFRKEINNN